MLDTLLTSTLVVTLAEIGDKTQLLSLALAARYRKSLPIVLAVLVATLVNHALAGGAGLLLAHWLDARILNWIVVASFALMAVWMLVPDKLDEASAARARSAGGVFMVTLVSFFIAEMGDKTQVATVALAARYGDFLAVVSGTTLGMMIANIPVIYLGQRFAERLPTRAVHVAGAAIFVVLGSLAVITALAGPASS